MIITQYGKDAIAAASAGQTKISFTNLKTSDTGTLTTDTYPDFQSIKQSISPSSITMDSQTDTAKVAGLFNNNNLGMAYQIKAVGLYATCAGAFAMATPRLFAYELFGTPDFMPLPSEAPTSYTYAFNTTINDAATVEVVVQPGDYALASDLQDVQGRLSDFALADDVQSVGIFEGTHTVNGTVHNITIGNTNVETIKFKATSDFDNSNTLRINNVNYNIHNTNGSAVLFHTGDMVLLLCDHQNHEVFIVNDKSFFICPSVSTIEEIQSWLLTIPPGQHPIMFFNAQAHLLTKYAVTYIGVFSYLGSTTTPRRFLELSSYGVNHTKFEGSVDNTTGAVYIQRSDTNILTLSDVHTSNLARFQAFIDNFNMGTQTFYCSDARSAAIGLPATPHLITVQQTNDYGKWTVVTACAASAEYPKRQIGKFGNPATWETDWTILPTSGHVLNAEEASDIVSFIFNKYPQNNIAGHFFIPSNYAASAGLPTGTEYSVDFRRRGGSFIVIAIPWNNASVEWRGNYNNSTWSGFTKYQLTPATLETIAFTYLSGVTHQAGSSKANGTMVFINECVKITDDVAKLEHLLTLPFSTGFAYGCILQKNSSNATITTSCVLSNGVVYPEQDLLLVNGVYPKIIITGWK